MSHPLPREQITGVDLPVQIIESARRTKTVSAKIVDGVLEVRTPVGMHRGVRDSHIRDLAKRLKRRRASTEFDLEARARYLAKQVVDKKELSESEKLTYIFRKATSRFPKKGELEKLENYYKEEYKQFSEAPDKSQKYLAQAEKETINKEENAEWAAYAVIANMVLNLDEAISRG